MLLIILMTSFCDIASMNRPYFIYWCCEFHELFSSIMHNIPLNLFGIFTFGFEILTSFVFSPNFHLVSLNWCSWPVFEVEGTYMLIFEICFIMFSFFIMIFFHACMQDKLKVYLAPFLHGRRYTSFGHHFTKVEEANAVCVGTFVIYEYAKLLTSSRFVVEDGDTVSLTLPYLMRIEFAFVFVCSGKLASQYMWATVDK